MRPTLLLALVTIVACGDSTVKTDDPIDGTDTASDTATDTAATDSGDTQDTAPACEATVVSLTPADGATDVPIDSTVVLTLSAPVTEGQASLAIAPAADGVAELSEDGTTLTWTPAATLARDTAHTVTATVCGTSVSQTFTTVGEAITAPIVGRTYDVDLAGRDLTWVKPNATAGAILVGQLETQNFLFNVQAADDTTIDLVGAVAYEDGGDVVQYECAPALDFVPGNFTSNPFFHVGPQDSELSASGITVPMLQLEVEGRFADDASAIEDVTLTGLIDVAELGTLLGTTDPCSYLAFLSISCVSCPDGSDTCVELEVRDASAPWADGATVDPTVDPDTNAACN
jgi:hypothetical protein